MTSSVESVQSNLPLETVFLTFWVNGWLAAEVYALDAPK